MDIFSHPVSIFAKGEADRTTPGRAADALARARMQADRPLP